MTGYRQRFHRLTAGVLVAALGVTGLSATAATASTVSPPATVTTSVATSGGSAAGAAGVPAAPTIPNLTVGGSLVGSGPVAPGPAAGGATTQGLGGIIVRAVVQAIKSFGSAVWKACVNAVKSGAKKFAQWWSGVNSKIKTAVKVIANLTAAELFHMLWDYLF